MSGFGKHEPSNHKGTTDVWLTPLEVIDNLGGNFDLDPCAHPGHCTAKTAYYDRGLEQPWFGNVWLNPPYSEVGVWIDKIIEHGNGTALVFARTDTQWAQRAMKAATSIFFIKGRLKFLRGDGSKHPSGNAGAPSMILTFGYKSDFINFEGFKAK